MNIEPYPIKTDCCREAVRAVSDELIDRIDKDINFFREIGTPYNQHRDVIIALMNFRRSIVKLKEGEQE